MDLMKNSILIKNGTIVTMDPSRPVLNGDLLIGNGRIEEIGKGIKSVADQTVDASGCAVLPGFVQTHIHLCQTLFRGFADDLALIEWLKQRVWPMEAAHNAASVRASARLGIAELIMGGTTCALTMETVNYTDEVFRVVEETGFRATVGKCMMDKGAEVPEPLRENTILSIEQSLSLLKKWHNTADGRIRACFAPRFAVSCTGELLGQVSALAAEHGVIVHTHASENVQEVQIVEDETGLRNVLYLHSLGLTGRHVMLANCIHLDEEELSILAGTGTNVSHCPSSNLKLGSGIARVSEMLDRGVSVSIGADGAPCNNRLDMFTEMRTAALLQKVTVGATALPAQQVLELATIGGARAMGLENEIGSLKVGKKADVIVVDLERLHSSPCPPDVISSIVYSSMPSDVVTTIIDGKMLMKDRELLTLNQKEVIADANRESVELCLRANSFR